MRLNAREMKEIANEARNAVLYPRPAMEISKSSLSRKSKPAKARRFPQNILAKSKMHRKLTSRLREIAREFYKTQVIREDPIGKIKMYNGATDLTLKRKYWPSIGKDSVLSGAAPRERMQQDHWRRFQRQPDGDYLVDEQFFFRCMRTSRKLTSNRHGIWRSGI